VGYPNFVDPLWVTWFFEGLEEELLFTPVQDDMVHMTLTMLLL